MILLLSRFIKLLVTLEDRVMGNEVVAQAKLSNEDHPQQREDSLAGPRGKWGTG